MDALPNIDISAAQWRIVSAILQKHIPAKSVWAFGSRAKHSAKPYSDLDLAIIGDTPLPLGVLAAIENDFTESDLPFKVDVIDWAAIGSAFRKIIETDHVQLF